MATQGNDRSDGGSRADCGFASVRPQTDRTAAPALPEHTGADSVGASSVAAAIVDRDIPLPWRMALLAIAPALAAAFGFTLLAQSGADAFGYLIAAVVLVAMSVALAVHQARRVARPLGLLAQRCALLAARYSGETAQGGRREITALAKSFDAMMAALLRHGDSLQQQYLAEAQTSLDLQRQYALMQMLRNLASAANNGDTLERALENSLREIGEYLDWPIGRLVLVQRKGTGEIADARSHWYAPDQERFAAFIEACGRSSREFEQAGLIGRARESNLSHWISDLGRLEGWAQRDAALSCGLRTGFVIPIAIEEDATAFVEFFSDHRIEAGAEMLELVEAISVELWQTANRRCTDRLTGASDAHVRMMASIAECMQRAIAVTAPHGKVRWVNANLAQLAALPVADAIGRDIVEVLFGTVADSAARCRSHIESGEHIAGLVLAARAVDAGDRWYEVEIQPIPDRRAGGAGSSGSFVFVRDVTRERATQLALNEALGTARQASTSKSQFLANMSHEIRTPMNGVLGMAELLLGTDLDERQRRYMQSLYRSGEALVDIINDILDFSKIEAGKLELESIDFDLRSLVEDLIELLAPRAHQKRIELAYKLSPSLPGTVRGDPTRLRQVLINIIGNAIKFTDRGEVVLTVDALADDPQVLADAAATRVRFVVRDTGIGMRPEALDRLFSVFMQADQSSSRRYGGTGLGLAICRQLTELMKGKILATSRVGEGSEFQVDLPLQHGDPAAVVAKPVCVGSVAGKRVLIAEDNPTNRRILDEQLTSFGMDCALAENGRQALQMLRIAANSARPFDLAVVDMKMPIMDGMALAEKVRGDHALHALRLVMLTSLTGRDDARRAQAIGIDAYLSKPVRQQELLSTLAAVLEPQPPAAAADAASSRVAELVGRRVLVVEDNLVNQEVVCAMLAAFGCEWRLAGDGLAALGLLERELFDAVLMDCQMPIMDGFEAIRRLHDPEYQQHDLVHARRTPVIALTANALAGDAERCRAAGFSDYLAKPFRQRDLAQMLLRWAPVGTQACRDGERPDGASPPAAAPALAPMSLPTVSPGIAPDAAAPPASPVDSNVGGALAAKGVLEMRVLDEIAAMERKGAKDLLPRLIDAYEASSALLVQSAEEGFGRDDPAGVAQALHTLKSSSANIGALRFSRDCNEIEGLARQQRLADARPRWREVRAEYEKVLAALKALRRLAGKGSEPRLAAAER